MDSQETEKVTHQKPGWEKTLLAYLSDFVHMMAVVVVIFILLFRIIVVNGFSMFPGLTDGDHLLLVSNLFYPNPKAGDVVVASKESFQNGTDIVKRVIATEGQTVDIDFEAGIVYVDGAALEEPYTNTPTNLEEGQKFPQTVEEGCVFVMGDNRNNSKDSRSLDIGQIDKREILGRAFFLFLPSAKPGQDRPDFGRIGVIR